MRTKPAAAPCNEDFVACLRGLVDATWRWALAQHRTSFSQPGHSRQRTVGPRCDRRSRSRSYKLGIFTTAPPAKSCRHLRPGMWSPVSLRGDSRPSRGSAAYLPDERLLKGCLHGRLHQRRVVLASSCGNGHPFIRPGWVGLARVRLRLTATRVRARVRAEQI